MVLNVQNVYDNLKEHVQHSFNNVVFMQWNFVASWNGCHNFNQITVNQIRLIGAPTVLLTCMILS